ncbi:hypothetical protein OAU50_05245 [Planctomycetota bacterium]|nr:hypothetical protein [Planctomycetota bacterium]
MTTRLLIASLAISLSGLIGACTTTSPEPIPEPVPKAAPDTLATKARAIIKKHCWQCHGQPDHPTYGEVMPLDWILDYDKLIEHRLVLPGKAGKSRLVYVMVMGEMPRAMDEHGSPSLRAEMPEEDIETVIDWIKQGARRWPEND